MSAEHQHHQALIETAWERTGGNNPLGGFGSFQGLYDSIPDRRRLVETVNGERHAVCIDERLIGSPSLTPDTTNYVRVAGEGILNPNAEEDLKRAGVTGIIAHVDCGAKALHAQGKGEGHPDDIGLAAVRTLADRVGVPIVGIMHPEGFRSRLHDARAIYYDGTGRFDWSRIKGFPVPGFIISRGTLSDAEYAQREVKVAISIAQGGHGLGKKFTPVSPLYLVGITDNRRGSVSMEVLMKELGQVADKHQAVIVDTLLAD